MPTEKGYLRWIGDIEYDSKSDNPNFKICNGEGNIIQYFNAGKGPVFYGGKRALLKTFKDNYKPISDKSQNGFIRIRFVVNCEGRAGRFRVLQSDFNYKETEFDAKIVSQLLDITQGIKNWVMLDHNSGAADYYFYLLFKINNGQISEIVP